MDKGCADDVANRHVLLVPVVGCRVIREIGAGAPQRLAQCIQRLRGQPLPPVFGQDQAEQCQVNNDQKRDQAGDQPTQHSPKARAGQEAQTGNSLFSP